MKKILLLSLLMLCYQLRAQTLFTYGDHKVSADEFLHAFQKNKTAADTGKGALKDYLDLYIIFKLKLAQAKALRLDTLPALQADLQSFRHQIEKNYLYDKDELQFLTDQATERSKKDIHVTALFIKPSGNLDSVQLLTAATGIAHALQNSGSMKGTVRSDVHVDTADMGFITVFTLPYDLENKIFALQPGQYSSPYQFGEGYYIFKNEEERPAAGKIRLSQILIAVAPDAGASTGKAARLADSLYHLLQDGADFSKLAKEFSNDRNTFFNGGEMQEFGVGKYSPDFEKHAFNLSKNGQVSRPFRTSFGYHILKRLSAEPVPQDLNPDHRYQIRQALLQDSRVEIARQMLANKARLKTGFHDNKIDPEDLFRVTDTSLAANKDITSGGVSSSTVLFTFNDGTRVTVNDWDQYLRNSGKVIGGRLHDSYKAMWPDFVADKILQNYQSRLAEFDPEFQRQLSEFMDGNMLFELMQRMVWTRAARDTAGLRQYYETHRSRYQWQKSADAIIFSCNTVAVAEACIRQLQHAPWGIVMEEHAITAQADSGRFELSQLPSNEPVTAPGITEVVVNQFDGTASFADVIKLYPGNVQRDFDDAKGVVIEDYQKVIEQAWIDALKTKYPVKVHEKVWKKISR